jgi:heme/copper-type cytochrome/quinol oxidase subunit 1
MHISWLLAISALVVWVLYLLTAKILLSKTLSWVHIMITILTFAVFILISYSGYNLTASTPKRYFDYSTFDTSVKYTRTVTTIAGILLTGQIIFIINLVAGLVNRRN